MDKDKKSAKQRLILGTHTSEGEQNYLMIAEVALPTSDSEAEASQYDEERGEVGGFGAATGRVQVRPPYKLICHLAPLQTTHELSPSACEVSASTCSFLWELRAPHSWALAVMLNELGSIIPPLCVSFHL